MFLARALKLQRFFLLTATASADSDCFISHCNALQCVLHVRSVQNSISTSRFGTIYLPSMCFGWDLVGLDQAREDLLNSQCIIIYKLKWPTRFSTWCCVIGSGCIGSGFLNSSSVNCMLQNSISVSCIIYVYYFGSSGFLGSNQKEVVLKNHR